MKKVNSLKRELIRMREKESFWRFDSFIMEQMGTEDRKQAWRRFREKTGRREIATIPTMERWFGIGGYATPRRSHIFEMIFAMGLDGESLNQYLMQGICEPGVRVNDYQEVIFLYGLGKKLSYEECLLLIEKFEGKLEQGIEVCHKTNTLELQRQFDVKKELPTEQFIEWLENNASAFKGYSRTALKYLIKFKSLVLDEVRRVTQEELQQLLEETGYEEWRKSPRRIFSREYEGNLIRKFIYGTDKVEESRRQEILEMVKCVYFEGESNVRALSEVFSVTTGECGGFRRMTEKRLSDLLNISTQKERDIQTGIAEHVLQQQLEKGDNQCPAWIAELLEVYGGERKESELSAETALQWIRAFRKEHRRRCALVQREDLLPFVLYESQRRYWESINNKEEAYQAEVARNDFVTLANQTMAVCNMTCISEQYALDATLLACFQPDEMYSYAEVLEMMESI